MQCFVKSKAKAEFSYSLWLVRCTMKLLFFSCVALAFTDRSWPYLQIYPPINDSDSRTPLYFGLMLSSANLRSIIALPGVQIALDYINSQPSILPGYTLHCTLTDSQVANIPQTSSHTGRVFLLAPLNGLFMFVL